MKHYIFIFFLILSTSCFSQENNSSKSSTNENSTEVYFKKLFSKIPASEYINLVPFHSQEKWGYIDRKTKKIMVPPILEDACFFNPDVEVYLDEETVQISDSGITVKSRHNEILMEEMAPNKDTKVKSFSDGFKGFIVSEKGELIAYSDLYQCSKQGIPGWNIQLFKYQNQYYGIVKNLQGQAGIIDHSGNPLKGFEFNYKEIALNRYAKDSINAWFYTKKSDSESFSLTNTKGEVKFQDPTFIGHFWSSDIFGYTIQQKGDTIGIFDNYNLEWAVKPQTKVEIRSLYFSSKRNLDREIPQNRNDAFVYYLVKDKDRQYFMDLKGNKYLPKQK